MKNSLLKFALIPFLLLLADPALAQKKKMRTVHLRPGSWTYIFYISGDNHYMGITEKEDGEIEHEDQAEKLFEEVREMARADRYNNYAIYYDAEGSPLFDRYQHFYEQGEHRSSTGLFSQDRDSSNPITFKEFFTEAAETISTFKSAKTLFYYYGEGLSSEENGFQHDLTRSDGSFSYQDLASGLDHLKNLKISIDVLVMHTCFQNDPRFFQVIAPYAQHFLIPRNLVSRSPLLLQSLMKADLTPNEVTEQILAAALRSKRPHPFYAYTQKEISEMGQLFKVMSDAITQQSPTRLAELAQEIYQTAIAQGNNASRRLDSDEVQVETLQDGAFVLSRRDVMMSFRDFYSLYMHETDPHLSATPLDEAKLNRNLDKLVSTKVSLPFVSAPQLDAKTAAEKK